MSDDILRVDWRGNIAIVTLTLVDRTGASAGARRGALRSALSELNAKDERCRAIVLTASADGFNFPEDAGDTREIHNEVTSVADSLALEVFRLLVMGRRPVVAAVEGSAAGAGLSLVAACDHVVASSTSHFASYAGVQELLPAGGLYWSLARRVRAGRARHMMLTGNVFNAQNALACGLVSLVVKPGEALDSALEAAARYAQMPRLAMAWLKAAAATGSDSLEQAIETETNIQPLLRTSGDHRDAVQAFLQKRPAIRGQADANTMADYEQNSPGIGVEKKGRIAILTINNPARRNALSRELRQELSRVLKDSMADDAVGAIVLTGAAGHFSAGADVSKMRERSVPEYRTLHVEAASIIREMMAGPKPVIAAVEGVAYGAGLSLVCAADFVVASPTARFCAAFIRVGLLPDLGILWTLPQKVGRAKAVELMALATELGAEDALSWGLISQVADEGCALDGALSLAETLTCNPPMAMALTKAALTGFNHSLAESLRVEIDYQSVLRASADHKEAVRAFMEKRTPSFLGR